MHIDNDLVRDHGPHKWGHVFDHGDGNKCSWDIGPVRCSFGHDRTRANVRRLNVPAFNYCCSRGLGPAGHSQNNPVLLESYLWYPFGMKISMSLPEEDVTFLDAYVEEKGLASRSAALHKAVRLLRASGLSTAYEAAWAEWSEGSEALWSGTTSDGLS